MSIETYKINYEKVTEAQSSSAAEHSVDGGNQIMSVPISDLLAADSPRLMGENADHVRVLADSEAELPPIVVHRPTMRVVDGMHRIRAALLRGAERIDVVFVDDMDGKDLFVLAVKSNIAHGLALTLADRQEAAKRIIVSHPQWSDRAIAAATGLAAKTVRTLRKRTIGDVTELRGRIGQDGKVRPLNSTDGRRLAGEILLANPHASIRQVATEAGISVGTAYDVRKRLLLGEGPGGTLQQRGTRTNQQVSVSAEGMQGGAREDLDCDTPSVRQRREAKPAKQAVVQDPAVTLRVLMKDPALRFTESGRILLHWLNSHGIGNAEWEETVENVPPHCVRTVADYARQVAAAWTQFAEELEEHEHAMA